MIQFIFFYTKSEVIGGATSYLGKLTSCQSGLTPRKETRLFLTKNDNGITKFGNGITENRNYIAEVHSDPDSANLLSIL